MISDDAVVNLFALAHPGRLNVFRTIVKAGPDGMAAGKIAAANGIPANTASTHLSILTGAGLLSAYRDGRSIIYRANFTHYAELMGFLLEDVTENNAEAATALQAWFKTHPVNEPPARQGLIMFVTLYHNPQCSTSRKTLELIRETGIEPVVVDYRKAGWTKDLLTSLFKGMKAKPRDLLRLNGTPAEELGLTDPAVSDDRLLAAMIEHPILVQRPIVVSDKGTILARPQEKVLEIL